MNEEKLIATLTDCVKYFADKYELGNVHKYVLDGGITSYIAGCDAYDYDYDFDCDFVAYERNEDWHHMEFHLKLNQGLNEVSIDIDTDYDNIRVEASNIEDYNYIYDRIKEALK